MPDEKILLVLYDQQMRMVEALLVTYNFTLVLLTYQTAGLDLK